MDDIIAYENGDLDAQQTLEMFSRLIKNGVVWKLQGSYGRQALAFIRAGYLSHNGDILQTEDDHVRQV